MNVKIITNKGREKKTQLLLANVKSDHGLVFLVVYLAEAAFNKLYFV